MEVMPKKRTKKKGSSIQMPSSASEAMNQFVGHDNMDEVRARKIKKEKELGSSSTDALGSDECREVDNVRKFSMASPPNVKESDYDTEFLDLLEDAFLDLESAVAESSVA